MRTLDACADSSERLQSEIIASYYCIIIASYHYIILLHYYCIIRQAIDSGCDPATAGVLHGNQIQHYWILDADARQSILNWLIQKQISMVVMHGQNEVGLLDFSTHISESHDDTRRQQISKVLVQTQVSVCGGRARGERKTSCWVSLG